MDLKIEADALNQRRRHFFLRRTIYPIYQFLWWTYPGYCACV